MSKTLMREVVGIVADVKLAICGSAGPDRVLSRTRTLPRDGDRAAHVRAAAHSRPCGERRRAGTRSGSAGRRHHDDGCGAGADIDVAALQRAAAWRCSRRWRCRSRQSGFTACSRTSSAGGAGRSASGRRLARERRTWCGSSCSRGWRLHSSVSGWVSSPRSWRPRCSRKLVFGVNASDPITLFGVAGILAFVALRREPRARLPCIAARSTRRSAGGLSEAVRRVGDRSAAEGIFGRQRPVALPARSSGVVEQLEGEGAVRDRRSGPERRGQEDCFCHFLARRACSLRRSRVWTSRQ